MWNEQKKELDAQLAPGETLLWSGEPRRGLFLRPSDLYLIPFSLLWGGFAVFWNFGVWNSNAPIFFRIWGLPFLAVGFHMIFGRFFVDAWQRSKTFYGVTNERVIVVSGIFSRNVKSLNLKTLTDISISERKDLSGTITFGPSDQSSSWSANFPFTTGWRNEITYPVFDSIADAKRVYDTIRNAQRST